jgi:hypothetical protein
MNACSSIELIVRTLDPISAFEQNVFASSKESNLLVSKILTHFSSLKATQSQHKDSAKSSVSKTIKKTISFENILNDIKHFL